MAVNSDATFSPDADARRLALEVIATLCNVIRYVPSRCYGAPTYLRI
jgi:hypothetical protein